MDPASGINNSAAAAPAPAPASAQAHRGLFDRLAWILRPGDTYTFVAWLWLRGLAIIFFSAFLALVFQINGLVGPDGILPAREYLQAIAQNISGLERYWLAPSLLWFGSGVFAVHLVAWAGLIASLLLFLNFQPRLAVAVCTICFVSFLAIARDFASYQSDGMLMGAGFISLFVAPAPQWRRLLAWRWLPAPHTPGPSWLSIFSLRWLWFTIYFDSGVMKLASHDPGWRHFTAMDTYYENGPLPTWLGWYAQKLPHGFHAASAFLVLLVELAVVWLGFFPRRFRIICFWIVTPLQIGIILTANYGFLNYVVLFLGLALLDDRHVNFLLRRKVAPSRGQIHPSPVAWPSRIGAIVLTALFLVTAGETLQRLLIWLSPAAAASAAWLDGPARDLESFRITDGYALFSVMTPARFELEFQGSEDGQNWKPYLFRHKPQNPSSAPGIYAPYQPRFDWNLWFASLGTWQDYQFVADTEIKLLEGDTAVIGLFAGDPFHGHPPQYIRVVRWEYWFSTRQQKRETGIWWTRKMQDLYAPVLVRQADGSISVYQTPRSPIPVVGGFHLPGGQ